MATVNKDKFGLIILGNSGVGKSFLANILLGHEAFKHEFSPRSVTHRTEFEEITIDDYDYAIFNIPGLIEADQARVDINKREIDHAFAERSNSLIIYVFGQQNGRIRDEDAVAFNAINKAYPLNIESLLVILNGLPSSRPKNYEGEAMLMLQDIIQVPITENRVCFLNQINRESIEERQVLRNQLLSSIIELSPTRHIKVQDIRLQVDEVAMLKKQIEEMTKAFEENKIFFENEIREQQKRYDDLTIKQKAETDYFQRIIDEQIVETRKMKEQQAAEVRQMEEHMRKMQAEHQRLTQEMINKSRDESESIRKALEQSNQAQAQLRQQIIDLQNRPIPTVYTTPQRRKKNRCVIS